MTHVVRLLGPSGIGSAEKLILPLVMREEELNFAVTFEF